MYYLSNNQGSKFILQIIITFVALIAKISQGSEPFTGCAFSGRRQQCVCNTENTVRAASQKVLTSAVELLPLDNGN